MDCQHTSPSFPTNSLHPSFSLSLSCCPFQYVNFTLFTCSCSFSNFVNQKGAPTKQFHFPRNFLKQWTSSFALQGNICWLFTFTLKPSTFAQRFFSSESICTIWPKNTVFALACKRLLLIKNSAMVSNLSTFRFCECVFVLSLHIHVLCFNGTERFQLQKNEHPITKGKFASASDISLQPNGEYVLTLDCDKALQHMIVE